MEITSWVRALRTRLSYWRRVWGCCSSLKAVAYRVVAPTQTRRQQPTRARSTEESRFKDYAEKTFGGDFETATDYLDPFIREKLAQSGNWAVFAPNPYGPKTLNYFAKSPNPSSPTTDNWLGTDDRGRDLLAQLISDLPDFFQNHHPIH